MEISYPHHDWYMVKVGQSVPVPHATVMDYNQLYFDLNKLSTISQIKYE